MFAKKTNFYQPHVSREYSDTIVVVGCVRRLVTSRLRQTSQNVSTFIFINTSAAAFSYLATSVPNALTAVKGLSGKPPKVSSRHMAYDNSTADIIIRIVAVVIFRRAANRSKVASLTMENPPSRTDRSIGQRTVEPADLYNILTIVDIDTLFGMPEMFNV